MIRVGKLIFSIFVVLLLIVAIVGAIYGISRISSPKLAEAGTDLEVAIDDKTLGLKTRYTFTFTAKKLLYSGTQFSIRHRVEPSEVAIGLSSFNSTLSSSQFTFCADCIDSQNGIKGRVSLTTDVQPGTSLKIVLNEVSNPDKPTWQTYSMFGNINGHHWSSLGIAFGGELNLQGRTLDYKQRPFSNYVKYKNIDSGSTFAASTDQSGNYGFFLPSGKYQRILPEEYRQSARYIDGAWQTLYVPEAPIIDVTSTGSVTADVIFSATDTRPVASTSSAQSGSSSSTGGSSSDTSQAASSAKLLSGKVMLDGKPAKGVNLAAINAVDGQAYFGSSDDSGNYSITVGGDGKYELKVTRDPKNYADTFVCVVGTRKTPLFSKFVTVAGSTTYDVGYSTCKGVTTTVPAASVASLTTDTTETTDTAETKTVTDSQSKSTNAITAKIAEGTKSSTGTGAPSCFEQAVGTDRFKKLAGKRPTVSDIRKAIAKNCFAGAVVSPDVSPVEAKQDSLDKLKKTTIVDLMVNKPELKPTSDPLKSKLVITGSVPGRPNTTVFIFLFSEPRIYAVTTDASANWQYEVTDSLEPGDHKVYVAMEKGGTYLSSEPITFAVTAPTSTHTPTPMPTIIPTPSSSLLPTPAPVVAVDKASRPITSEPLFYTAILLLGSLIGILVFQKKKQTRLLEKGKS